LQAWDDASIELKFYTNEHTRLLVFHDKFVPRSEWGCG